MIPPNLTTDEVGAYLRAVGQLMQDHDCWAPRLMNDQGDGRDEAFTEALAENSFAPIMRNRAEQLTQLTLAEAISFESIK